MIDLKEMQSTVNLILKSAREVGTIKGVNWGDLRCVDALECRSVYGETIIMIEIEECSPDSNLRSYVYEKLHLLYPDLQFDVRTEW